MLWSFNHLIRIIGQNIKKLPIVKGSTTSARPACLQPNKKLKPVVLKKNIYTVRKTVQQVTLTMQKHSHLHHPPHLHSTRALNCTTNSTKPRVMYTRVTTCVGFEPALCTNRLRNCRPVPPNRIGSRGITLVFF